jgi:hypothetical protein
MDDFDGFIKTVIVAVVLYAILIGGIAYVVVNYVDWSHGLKGVVEQVWCGEKGC